MALSWFSLGVQLLVAQGAVPAPAIACEQVEVGFHREHDRDLALRVARAACTGAKRLRALFARTTPGIIRVRITSDMDDWRRMSHRPWYVAAALVGNDVVTQPPRSLRRLSDLEGTIVHELAHLFIRRAAGRNCPRWLDEGLAHLLAGQKFSPGAEPESLPGTHDELAALEKRLVSGRTGRRQLQRDYAVCLRLVRRIVDRAGIHTLIRALPGLRQGVTPLDMHLGQKQLRDLLF